MVNSPLEKGQPTPQSAEQSAVVVQPHKAEGLAMFLDQVNEMVSEQASERAGGQGGAGGGMTATGNQQAAQTVSWRDQAIASLPAPQVMQKQLESHIRDEVKRLRREADQITRLAQPGAAYQAAQLWARIRRLNALLAELLEASVELIKRIFVRVFIDRQAII